MIVDDYLVKSYKDLYEQIMVNLDLDNTFHYGLISNILWNEELVNTHSYTYDYEQKSGGDPDTDQFWRDAHGYFFNEYFNDLEFFDKKEKDNILEKFKKYIRKNCNYAEFLDRICHPKHDSPYLIIEEDNPAFDFILDIYMKNHLVV